MLESAYILEVLTLSNICSYRCTVGRGGKKQQRGGYVYQSSKVRYLVKFLLYSSCKSHKTVISKHCELLSDNKQKFPTKVLLITNFITVSTEHALGHN